MQAAIRSIRVRTLALVRRPGIAAMKSDLDHLINTILAFLGGIAGTLATVYIAIRSGRTQEKQKRIEADLAENATLNDRVKTLEAKWDEHQVIIARQALELAETKAKLEITSEKLQIAEKKLADAEVKLDASEEANRELHLINGNLRQQNQALIEQLADKGLLPAGSTVTKIPGAWGTE